MQAPQAIAYASPTLSASLACAVVSQQVNDLLIVGPGVLGGLVGKLWKDTHPKAIVIGQTNTTRNHESIQKMGLATRLKPEAGDKQFPSVLFSAPPSGSSDYVQEVHNALNLWDGTRTFIFTSSSGALCPSEGENLSEETPLHQQGTSDRIDRLLDCERIVLEAGGCIVRLVGLYHANRGAHAFFLRQGEVHRWGGRIINLIHYEDAAALCIKVLAGAGDSPFHSQVFFGTDAQPLTFQEMMQATLASGSFKGSVTFVGSSESHAGPGSSNLKTRELLKWAPKYPSFKSFMASGAEDFYTFFELQTLT